MKYVYFEIYHVTGYGSTEKKIRNENILLNKPHTNSNGFWGFTNITEMYGFPEKSFIVVEQNWIDLEKYKKSGTDFMKNEINEVIRRLGSENTSNFNIFIDWNGIWNEVDIEISLMELEDNGNIASSNILKSFMNDSNLTLDTSECFYDKLNDEFVIYFTETGDQNESDNQGWSRIYSFTVNSDFAIVGAEYEQG